MTSWIDPSLALPLPRQDGSPRVIHFNRPTFLLTNRDPSRLAPRDILAHPPTRLLEPWTVGHFRWDTFGGSLSVGHSPRFPGAQRKVPLLILLVRRGNCRVAAVIVQANVRVRRTICRVGPPHLSSGKLMLWCQIFSIALCVLPTHKARAWGKSLSA